MRKYLLILLPLLLISLTSPTKASTEKIEKVLVVKIEGAITRATVELIKGAIKHASDIGAGAILITIDTPGGGLEETKQIVKLIENCKKITIGFVYPRGATAWSAGVFVLLSTDIAVMQDGTTIGSCQPVEITSSGPRLVNESKYINAIKEWIKELASSHHRNSTVAEKFVTENLNLNASEALKKKVIDFVATDISDLLDKINGSKVDNVTLVTRYAEVIYYSPPLSYHILSILSNPIVYSILLVLGMFSIILGIHTPGYGAEVFGIIAIGLALAGMGFSLPYMSIIFLALGFILLVIEIFVTPGFGFIGIGGIICIILGTIFLVPSYSSTKWLISQEYQNLLLIMAIVPSALISGFFVFILYKVIRVKGKKPALTTFEGEEAETLEELSPNKPGFVRYRGEYWLAKSRVRIPAHTKVIIEKREGHILIVSPKKEGKD